MAHSAELCEQSAQITLYIYPMPVLCWVMVCDTDPIINPQSSEIRNLNFQSLEVVSRYRDPQLQVTKNVLFVKFKSQHTLYISVSRLKA